MDRLSVIDDAMAQVMEKDVVEHVKRGYVNTKANQNVRAQRKAKREADALYLSYNGTDIKYRTPDEMLRDTMSIMCQRHLRFQSFDAMVETVMDLVNHFAVHFEDKHLNRRISGFLVYFRRVKTREEVLKRVYDFCLAIDGLSNITRY